jgi:hypothetical protein
VTPWPTGPEQQKSDYPEPERHFHHTSYQECIKNCSKSAQKHQKKHQKNIIFRAVFDAFLVRI